MYLLIANLLLWLLVYCTMSGCSLKRPPAQQQRDSHTTHTTTHTTIPVDQIDIDGDGQISPQEQQQISATHHITPVVISFVSIVGLVLVINLVLARAATRRGNTSK